MSYVTISPTEREINAICSNPKFRKQAEEVAMRVLLDAYDHFVAGKVIDRVEGWELAMRNPVNWIGHEDLK